ncbi:reverse transcriptase domain-containing protein [Tanacetum coccineum]
MPFPSEAEVERLLALLPPPLSPLISLSPPVCIDLARAAKVRNESHITSIHHPLIPSPPLPPLPSSLYLPPPVTTSSPLPSPPLPPLPASLFIPPPIDRVGESSTATAARPTGGHRADYGFIGTLDAKTRCQRFEEFGYSIKNVWVDPTETVKEIAPTTLEGVNARVTELAEVQEEDTQDIYVSVGLSLAVHQELQAYRTHTQIQDHRIASLEALTTTLVAHVSFLQGQLSAALGQIQALQARDLTHVDDLKGADNSSTANNMPPKRTSAAAARVAAAVAAAAPMTRDGSHNSDTGIRGIVRTPTECTYKDFLNCQPFTFKGTEGVVVLSQWDREEGIQCFHISQLVVRTQFKFDYLHFLGNLLTWWNSHMKTVTIRCFLCYGLEDTKEDDDSTDVASYTLRFQELALMCGRMLHEESDEVEKYVGGLPDMIREMGTNNKTRDRTIARAYTARPGKKREYTGSLPLCTKCNYHHKGPCAPRCNKCKKIGHLARDCRSSDPNGNNNNRGNFGMTQNAGTCYECGVRGHFKRDCPKLKNRNRGNQGGNGNAPAKVYMVGLDVFFLYLLEGKQIFFYLLEGEQNLSVGEFDNAQIDLFVAKYKRTKKKDEEKKFSTSTKNPASKNKLRKYFKSKRVNHTSFQGPR